MHDPSTVAFEIKYPWVSSVTMFKDGSKHKYRSSFITIWHEDPLHFTGADGKRLCGCRDDDSCGWYAPPFTQTDRDRIQKLAREQFGHIWAKLKAVAEGKDYAYVCNMPEDCYDAIYWTWRAIKQKEKPRGRWMYHERGLSIAELRYIYDLATNPVDNLKMRMMEVKDEDTCEDWFLLIYKQFLRFNRPWYRHPRWHIQHWRFQVHPWRTFRRWAFSRCAGCGGRFAWGESPTGFNWDPPKPKFFCSEVDVYHSDCAGKRMALQRAEPAGTA